MARIFISHSSRDNDWAVRVRDWLKENGWDDIFLDLDPVRGIVAGERWKAALQKAAHRCEVVLTLVSPHWLASPWCKAETDAARLMGKRVIVALIGADKAQIPLDLTDEQWVDLANDPDGFARLKEGLRRLGLDPATFPFERGRRPYPGFAALEEKDAAIFFGRDAQIVRGLDKMRGLTRTGVDRMLVILGASGAGKSSFLRAGLWPRLKRDDRAWLPLPTIRPERAVLSGKFGLAQALQQIASEAPFAAAVKKRDLPRSRAAIEELVTTREDGLAQFLAALREAAHVPSLAGDTLPPPTIVIPIDQGEELFNDDGRSQAERFIDILTRTLRADSPVLALLAMRTDAFPQLQTDPLLADLPKDTFTLDMMLEGSYRAVIEGPARLVEPKPLAIDPQLTDALLEDVSGQDGLPLLAFTLQHLYDRYSADGRLTFADYEKLGRLKGVIATTVAKAMADGVGKGELPRDTKAQIALVRLAFIPHLARVNAAGQFVRRVAARAEIPAEARPLVDRFAEHRLLTKDRRHISGEDQEVIEVAHEALLREWRKLNEALQEEREFLVAKGQLEHDVAEWLVAPEPRKKGALLTGNKLARARACLVVRPADLSADERRFIQASVDLEAAQRRRRVWLAGLSAVSVGALALAGLAIRQTEIAQAMYQEILAAQAAEKMAREAEAVQWKRAERNGKQARQHLEGSLRTESHFRAEQAARAVNAGDAVTGMLLALESLPDDKADDEIERTRPHVVEAEHALYGAWQAQRERAVLKGHTGAVWSAVFSPDGARVLTASRDKTARLWDVASGRLLATLEGHQDIVRSAVFSPDGRRVLTASADKTARLWEAATGRLLATFEGHQDIVRSAAFSPEGGRVLTASADKTARLWEAESGRLLATLEGHQDTVSSAVFSPDGARVLTASSDKTARLWESASGRLLATFKGHQDYVSSAVFSPDGARVLTASVDKTARLWEAASGRPLFTLKGEQGVVESAVFSPDGARVLTAARDKNARLWDARSGRLLATLEGHEDVIRSAVFSPDGVWVLTASRDKTAKVWEAASGRLLATLEGHEDAVRSAIFSPDGARVLTVSNDTTARVWEASSGSLLATLEGHEQEVLRAVFSPGGARILTASGDKTARLWEALSGRLLTTLQGHQDTVSTATFSPDGARVLTASVDKTARLWETASGRPLAILEGHKGAVLSAVFSPDGARVLTASKDKTARLWEAASGRLLATFEGHQGGLCSAVFSPDGARVLTASWDKTARLWEAASGRLLATFEGRRGAAWSAVFSPDGARVLIAFRDRTARLWDAASGQLIAALDGHQGVVRSAVFSPDGTRVLTASSDKTARLWDAASGRPLATLEGHRGSVGSAAFSADGTRVLTASADKTARLWEAASGRLLATLERHRGTVSSAVFSPDGARVLTASDDKTALLWRVFTTTQDLVNHVKAVVPRCLTPEQRHRLHLAPSPPGWCRSRQLWPYDAASLAAAGQQ